MIKLERIQYRCLRIALGCMHSTHTMSLEVLAGVLPLQDRFFELSLRFLIRSETMNPLVIENFERILELRPQTRFMTIYYHYMTLEISPAPSVRWSDNVKFNEICSSAVLFDLSMKQETCGIPDHTRSIVVPPIFAAKYGHISCEKMFFTDGSLIHDSIGFGVYNVNHSSSFQLSSPCSIYVAELAAIHQALVIIEALPSDHYFIFSDSLSSVEALRSMKPVKHATYFLMKIRDLLCAMAEKSFMITLAWVPSHCSIPGNERADSLR